MSQSSSLELLDRPADIDPGVVDQDVDPAQRVERPRPTIASTCAATGHVGGDAQRLPSGRAADHVGDPARGLRRRGPRAPRRPRPTPAPRRSPAPGPASPRSPAPPCRRAETDPARRPSAGPSLMSLPVLQPSVRFVDIESDYPRSTSRTAEDPSTSRHRDRDLRPIGWPVPRQTLPKTPDMPVRFSHRDLSDNAGPLRDLT